MAVESFTGKLAVVTGQAAFNYESYPEMYGLLIAKAQAEASGTREP